MCKQDIGMWKVIARTYQGSLSRRGELCYQLPTHGNTDDPTFFLRLSNIYEKMRVVYFSQIRTNSENKDLHTKYIKSVSVIMHMFERLNEVIWYSGYIWTLYTKWVLH